MSQITKSIKYRGIEMEVEMYFEKGDPGVWTYYNGDPGYPATPDEYWVESIKVHGVDIFGVVSEYDIEQIEKLMLENDND